MIFKIASAQPTLNNYKHNPQTVKDRLKKVKSGSFARVLEDTIKSIGK
jgi:hypothetical protein